MFEAFDDYLVPLLRLMDSLPQRRGQAGRVLSQFEQRYRNEMPSAHYRQNSSGRFRWRVHVYWSRQKAVQLGLMDSPDRGLWRLTEEGHRWLVEHPNATRLEGRKQAGKSHKDQETERGSRRQYKSFFAQVESHLATELADDVKALNPEFKAGHNLLQIHLHSFGGCHYEIRLGREYHEIALHFESSQRRNEMRRQAFEPHLEALNSKVGHVVRAEAWGQARAWARVWIKLPTSTLSATLAERYAGLAGRFIGETFPILKSVYAAETARRQARRAAIGPAKSVALGGRYAILDREIEAIRAFLEGRTEQRPTGEQLCEWVRFCYAFELYAEACALFAHVSSDDLNPWYFDRTKRIAKICQMKANAHG